MIEKILAFIAINLLYSLVSYFIAFFNNSKLEHGFLFEIKPEQIKSFKWLFHFRKRKDGTILKTCYYTQVFSVLRFILSIVVVIILALLDSTYFLKIHILILFIGYIIITGVPESCFRLVTFIIDYYKAMKNNVEKGKGRASVKWLRALTILLVILIVGSGTSLIVLTSKYMKYEGEVEGTGFIRKEVYGVGKEFDIDDYGNLYFVADHRNIVIYDWEGKYLYTLVIPTSGSVNTKIDDQNNILVEAVRAETINHYSNNGILEYIDENITYSQRKEIFPYDSNNVRIRNGITYTNKNKTITREENGVETVVFTVPVWQRWYGAMKTVLTISAIALFFRISIPLWAKEFRKMNKNFERIKKEQATKK